MAGGSGNDRVYGDDGNDSLEGGSGDDTIYGGLGNDIITSGSGADRAYGDDGNDSIDGGGGSDTIYGGLGNDVVAGSGGTDRLFGGTGNDAIIESSGDDSLYGGDGNDVLTGNGGHDRIFGGDGTDAAVYSQSRSHYTITSSGSDVTIAHGSDRDVLTGVEFARFTDQTVALTTTTNHAPVTTADTANVSEDAVTPALGNVLTNDSDPDGTTLAVAAPGTFAGTYGALVLAANGAYTYTLNNGASNVQGLAQGQTVTDTFAYSATDGSLATPSSLAVTIRRLCILRAYTGLGEGCHAGLAGRRGLEDGHGKCRARGLA